MSELGLVTPTFADPEASGELEVRETDLTEVMNAAVRLTQQGIGLFATDVPVGTEYDLADAEGHKMWVPMLELGIARSLQVYRQIDKAMASQRKYTRKQPLSFRAFLNLIKPLYAQVLGPVSHSAAMVEEYGGVVQMTTYFRRRKNGTGSQEMSFSLRRIANDT